MLWCLLVQEDFKLSQVLSKLAEIASEYKSKGSFRFRPYYNLPSRNPSISEQNSGVNINGTLHYKTMVNLDIFDMNTEVRNLPTTELEVVNVIEGFTRNGSDYRSGFPPPSRDPDEEEKQSDSLPSEEAKTRYTESTPCDYTYEVYKHIS